MINYEPSVDQILSKIDMELLVKYLAPKERDILLLWLNGGYSRQEVAEIIKARYLGCENLDGHSVGVKIQTIISKLRAKINPKPVRIRKRRKNIK